MYDRDGRWIAVRCYQRGAVDQHIDVFVVSLNPDDNPFARTPQLDPISRPQHQIIFRSAKYKTVVGRMLAIGPDFVCPVMVGNIGQNDFSSGVGRITNRTEFRAGNELAEIDNECPGIGRNGEVAVSDNSNVGVKEHIPAFSNNVHDRACKIWIV